MAVTAPTAIDHPRAPFPGAVWRAPYACDPARSRGRAHNEADSASRTPFQRDRDRILHARAFRRLKQKTQVFVAHEGDDYRTRLTHSLEVAQIARSLARTLGLDEDLAETLALAHDLGHPPFGHAGEKAIDQAMAPFGGFDHNAQALRVVTHLESRYIAFRGLNLAWETREGLVKHNGPAAGADAGAQELPWALTAYDHWRGLELETHASLEAQVAAIADDIAYNNHDIDDGLRAGLFSVEDLLDLPLIGDTFRAVRLEHPDARESQRIFEAVRRLIGVMVNDVVAETQARLDAARPGSVEAVRAHGASFVAFSDELLEADRALRAFLMEHMYRHYHVNRKMSRARTIVRQLFEAFLAEPNLLPTHWEEAARLGGDQAAMARIVCDYIAGMTDSYALEEHRKLFDLEADW